MPACPTVPSHQGRAPRNPYRTISDFRLQRYGVPGVDLPYTALPEIFASGTLLAVQLHLEYTDPEPLPEAPQPVSPPGLIGWSMSHAA
jgi:hypothetical protein